MILKCVELFGYNYNCSCCIKCDACVVGDLAMILINAKCFFLVIGPHCMFAHSVTV